MTAPTGNCSVPEHRKRQLLNSGWLQKTEGCVCGKEDGLECSLPEQSVS